MTKLEMRCWRVVIDGLYHLIAEAMDIRLLIENPKGTWRTSDPAPHFFALSGMSRELTNKIGDW